MDSRDKLHVSLLQHPIQPELVGLVRQRTTVSSRNLLFANSSQGYANHHERCEHEQARLGQVDVATNSSSGLVVARTTSVAQQQQQTVHIIKHVARYFRLCEWIDRFHFAVPTTAEANYSNTHHISMAGLNSNSSSKV